MNLLYPDRRFKTWLAITDPPLLKRHTGEVIAWVSHYVGGHVVHGLRWDHTWWLGTSIDDALDEIMDAQAWRLDMVAT